MSVYRNLVRKNKPLDKDVYDITFDDIKGCICPTKDEVSYNELTNCLYYFTPEYAKEKFNADSVFTYPILIPKGVSYYGNKYCQRVIIRKEGKSPAELFCFYNEEAKKNLDKYMKAIEGILRYRD